MEVTKKSTVSAENYAEIKNMMLSNDEASTTLALTILEQSDYEKSEVYIMCMLKDCFREAFGTAQKFQELSPILSKKVTNALEVSDIEITKLSFKEVYDLAIKRNIRGEAEFALDLLRNELVLLLKDIGYDFTDFTEVLIKPQGWEETNKQELLRLATQIEEMKHAVLNG